MENAFELIATLVQMFVWGWFLTSFFGRKYNKVIHAVGFISVWLLTFCETVFVNEITVYDGLASGLMLVTFFMYTRLFLKGNLYMHIFINIFAVAIIFTASSVLIFIMSYLSGINTEGIIADLSAWRAIAIILCRVIEIVVFKFIVKINSKHKLSKKEWALFIAMPLATWMAVVFMTEATIKEPSVLSEMFYIAVIMVVINVIIYFFMLKIKEDTETKIEYELLKMQHDNVKNMEDNMNALYESTYSVKHDIEKHLLAVKILIEAGNYESAESYIDEIVTGLNDVQRVVFTDNDVFNAIVNTKLALCKKKGIFPKINVADEAIGCIRVSDIAVLFGNLLDNAIEAAEKTDEKIIIMNVMMKREYVSIYIENSFNAEFSNAELKTTKKNKEGHGIGTKNVKKIVAENDGMIDYFVNDDGMFCCDILLKKSNSAKIDKK